jgi:hypothetical protein
MLCQYSFSKSSDALAIPIKIWGIIQHVTTDYKKNLIQTQDKKEPFSIVGEL